MRRKERTRRNAHVSVYQEDSGNMGLSAREMPNRDGQVAWQNIEARALDLHAAGIPGTTGQLHVQALLDFLLGRATPARAANENAREGACQDARTSARQNARGGGRGGWAVNPILVIPWDAGLGRPSGPAELPGYGLLDEQDTMDLLDAAGQDPASRWCVTMTGPDGTAAAHGCIPGPHTLADIRPGESAANLITRLNVTLRPIAKGACEHAHAEPGYRPSRKLWHLVMARNTRCTAPGCGRPAAACDQDHTTPWDDGGITCGCGLAPPCKR